MTSSQFADNPELALAGAGLLAGYPGGQWFPKLHLPGATAYSQHLDPHITLSGSLLTSQPDQLASSKLPSSLKLQVHETKFTYHKIHHFNHFTVYKPVAVSTYTWSCNHSHHPVPERSSPQRETHEQSLPFHTLPSPCNQESAFCLRDSTPLDISFLPNHTLRGSYFSPSAQGSQDSSMLEPGSAFIPLFGLKSILLCGYMLLCLPIDRCWTSELFPPFGSCDSSCKEHLWASVGLSTGPQDLGWILLEEESLGHTETLCLTCEGTTQLFHGGGELIF